MSKIAAPKLLIDKESMLGTVSFPDSWSELDAFTRLDIMQGWTLMMDEQVRQAEIEIHGDAYVESLDAKDEMEFRIAEVAEHPLFGVLLEAVEQAMFGKGERHGGNVTPFLEQPWVHYAKMHGRGFLTGQAAKKLEEAASTRDGKAYETEVLGSIVYSGMSVLKERGIV